MTINKDYFNFTELCKINYNNNLILKNTSEYVKSHIINSKNKYIFVNPYEYLYVLEKYMDFPLELLELIVEIKFNIEYHQNKLLYLVNLNCIPLDDLYWINIYQYLHNTVEKERIKYSPFE
jgi:hypothetical protein